MKKINILLLLILCLTGCRKNAETTIISGEIKGLGNDTIYLYGLEGLYERIDTIYVNDGKFSFAMEVDTVTSAMLLFNDQTEYPVFLDKNNEIKILGDADKLGFLNITGNAYNEELTAFQTALQGLGTPSDKVLEEKAEEFIRQHNSSLVSIYLLDKYFIQNESPDFRKIKELLNGLTGTLQDRPYLEILSEYITRVEKVNTGKVAPFFNLTNEKGEKITRMGQFKDKYLLINFWASWSKDCDKTNAMLRKINSKYKKNKNFGLLGISLDIDKEAWKDAIKQDTLKWEQTCDFTGWNSEIVNQYAIQKLPANILVSPAGIIVARDIPTDSLSYKIEEVLKKDIKK